MSSRKVLESAYWIALAIGLVLVVTLLAYALAMPFLRAN